MQQTMGLTRGLAATLRRQRLLHALLDDPDEADEGAGERPSEPR